MTIAVVDMTPQEITKVDDEHRQVFGFFNVAVRKDGALIEDLQGDIITPEVLESAAYEFVKESRQGGTLHKGDPTAVLIESMVITPDKLEALGLSRDAVKPRWWGGFQVLSEKVWKEFKAGEFKMFSIEGTATRVPVKDA